MWRVEDWGLNLEGTTPVYVHDTSIKRRIMKPFFKFVLACIFIKEKNQKQNRKLLHSPSKERALHWELILIRLRSCISWKAVDQNGGKSTSEVKYKIFFPWKWELILYWDGMLLLQSTNVNSQLFNYKCKSLTLHQWMHHVLINSTPVHDWKKLWYESAL